MLEKLGLSPTTIELYLGHALALIDYINETPPPHSRLSTGELVQIARNLRALKRLAGRSVLGHQVLVKQAKQANLVTKDTLLEC